jgi:hypothetical protein
MHGQRMVARKRQSGEKFVCLTSGSEKSGEGEFKIFRHLNELAASQPAGRALVVSNDSDVLLFAVLSRYRNIDVLRMQAGEEFLIDAASIRDHWAVMLGVDPRDEAKTTRVLYDVVFLSLMLGSDYTPPCRTYDFHQTIRAYKLYRASASPSFIVDLANETVDVSLLSHVLRSRTEVRCANANHTHKTHATHPPQQR